MAYFDCNVRYGDEEALVVRLHAGVGSFEKNAACRLRAKLSNLDSSASR